MGRADHVAVVGLGPEEELHRGGLILELGDALDLGACLAVGQRLEVGQRLPNIGALV